MAPFTFVLVFFAATCSL